MKPFLKYGLLFFAASAILTLLKYFINRELIFNTSIAMASGIILSILFIVLAIKEDRGEESGYTLGDGLKTGFLTYAIGTLLTSLFTYILVTYIDPQLIQEGIDYGIRVATNMIEKTADIMGIDEAQKAEMIAQATKDAAVNPFTPAKLMLGYVINLIGGLIIALIAGAIMKRD